MACSAASLSRPANGALNLDLAGGKGARRETEAAAAAATAAKSLQ